MNLSWTKAKSAAVSLLGLGLVMSVGLSESLQSQIRVSVAESKSGSFQVQASFFVTADRQRVWELLTDYDEIDHYVSSIQASDLVERGDEQILVKQAGRLKWLMFQQDMAVLLRVTEVPNESISFEDLSGDSFSLYAGSWQLETRANGTLVKYQIESKPKFFVPPFISRTLFANQVREMLEQLRQRT